jgi:threonine synthase
MPPSVTTSATRPTASPMRFASTRNAESSIGFGEALLQGLAPDGGLYVPNSWPRVDADALAGLVELPQLAAQLLAPFVVGDAFASVLPAVTREAFDFPAPVVPLAGEAPLGVLELFHGPTAAFKDFGARFLAASMVRLRQPGARPLTILVATSGDTGGAVAAAFHGKPGVEVAVLFPKGLVSPTQERQLTCWGGNVRSFAVRGTFDDCQRMVKQAFLDPQLRQKKDLSSANSINLGRLLPQAVYYASTSLRLWRETDAPVSFVIPAGNLGNAMACLWARKIGLPIGRIVLAHNANRTVPDFLDSGTWRPRPSVATLASAMDVGDPSNMERMRSLFPEIRDLRWAVTAYSVSDDDIRKGIRRGFETLGQIWCPHTAAAAEAYTRLSKDEQRAGPWVIVSTAHAAKFPEIVEPLIGRKVPVPESLGKLFARPVACTEIDADVAALRASLTEG